MMYRKRGEQEQLAEHKKLGVLIRKFSEWKLFLGESTDNGTEQNSVYNLFTENRLTLLRLNSILNRQRYTTHGYLNYHGEIIISELIAN